MDLLRIPARVLPRSFWFGGFLIVCTLSARLHAQPPSGLLCDLLPDSKFSAITDAQPEFSWIVNCSDNNCFQTSYQIIVSSSLAGSEDEQGDIWNSGTVSSDQSINVEYSGTNLASNKSYWWRVRTALSNGTLTQYSAPSQFNTRQLAQSSLSLFTQTDSTFHTPATTARINDSLITYAFSKHVFGKIKIEAQTPSDTRIKIRLGEKLLPNGRIDSNPNNGGCQKEYIYGCIYYGEIDTLLRAGTTTLLLPPPNNSCKNIKCDMVPFRYCEISSVPEHSVEIKQIAQIGYHCPFDDSASLLTTTDHALSHVYELCKYSIKATSFMGLYIDGHRERKPYEGDALINMLSHFAVDREYSLARSTLNYLIKNPTWPWEYRRITILIALYEYLYTGNDEFLKNNYTLLKNFLGTEESNNLVRARPIVDWPEHMADRFDYGHDGNIIASTFQYAALRSMAEIALQTGNVADTLDYQTRARAIKSSINTLLYKADTQRYVDRLNSDHSSMHANAYPLVFDIVPDSNIAPVGQFVVSRGMACNVYGAQFLLDALYKSGNSAEALKLITANTATSWLNMINNGATITTEVWGDLGGKPNQDLNHPWATAPSNIIARHTLGVTPMLPGFKKVQIRPNPQGLSGNVFGRVPTIRGPIEVSLQITTSEYVQELLLPANMIAEVWVPNGGNSQAEIRHNGVPVQGVQRGNYAVFDSIGSGQHIFSTASISSSKPVSQRFPQNRFSFSHSFAPRRTIVFHLSSPVATSYQITIFDLSGRQLHSFDGNLRSGQAMHDVLWNAGDTSKKPLSAGTYLALAVAGSSQKCTLIHVR